MSQQDNIRIVKEIYDAVGRGDVDAILERVTDDVDWAAEVAGTAAPWHGPRTGKHGRRQLLRGHQHQHRDLRVHAAQLRRRRRRRPPPRRLDVPTARQRARRPR